MLNNDKSTIIGSDLRALIPFLACNSDYSFAVINSIYHEYKYDRGHKTSPLYIFTEKEFKNYIATKNGKPSNEKPYLTPIYDISSNQIVWFNLYTDKNFDAYKPNNPSQMREEIDLIFNSLIEFFNRQMIVIKFDDHEIYKESYKHYDLEDRELVFYDYKNLVEKIYVLLEVFLRNVFMTDNKILINLVFYEVLNRKVSLSIIDNNYSDISVNQLQNIYEYSRIILEFINMLLTDPGYIDLANSDENSINDQRVNINNIIFSDMETLEVFNEIQDNKMNLLLNNLDEINILQSYKYWNLGDKNKYITSLNDIDSMKDLSNKLNSYSEEKVKAILLNNQYNLQIIRSNKKNV